MYRFILREEGLTTAEFYNKNLVMGGVESSNYYNNILFSAWIRGLVSSV